MESQENKQHWNELGSSYSKAWFSKAKQFMAAREKGFIQKYFKKTTGNSVLDMGVGNGRIIDAILEVASPETKIDGLDISEKMIEVCTKKFANEARVNRLQLCDVSSSSICYDGPYSFITSIRVLKYNKNWQEMIKKTYAVLNKGGIYVFTIPNANSLNYFSNYYIKDYKTTYRELVAFLERTGFKVMEIRTFTRIPDVFYDMSSNKIYVWVLTRTEVLLDFLFGPRLFGRKFFVAVQK